MMKKLKYVAVTALLFAFCVAFSVSASAAAGTHTVAAGESMWKIAVCYQIGISELIAANPSVKNPAMIMIGQKLNVPNIDDVKTLEANVAELVNAERARAGLAPLKLNWEVSRVARYKSQDMIDKKYFAHQSPTYGSPFNMMENFEIRFSAGGENIAYGQRTPAEVMQAWMNSPGHRANIMSPIYTEIGVGAAKASNGTLYWTQMFIKA